MSRTSTNRRTFLKKTAAATAALTLTPTLGFPNLHLKPYAGRSLTIYQQASPIFEGAFELFQPYFEDLTGAKISFVSIPVADMGQQIALSLTADKGEMDLTWYYAVYPLVLQGLVQPIDDFIKDPNLTPPKWDFADYLPGALESGRVDGRLYNLSVTANALAFYYRTDKIADAGFVDEQGRAVPPVTWDDVQRYGQALDARRDKPLLLMYSPNGTQCTQIWLSLWLSQDYTYIWDQNGKCIVNNADGLVVTRLLKDLLKWASPTNVTWDFPEAHAAFQQGRGAMLPQWNNLGGIYNDPANSLAAGKLSMAPWPRIKVSASDAGHWYSLIAANSPDKELAWVLVREYNSYAWQKKFFLNSAVNFNPSRKSVYDDPEVKAAYPWIHAIRDSNNNGRGQQRRTLEWEAVQLVLQEELGPYVTDETNDAQQVLDRIAARVDEITRASGRFKG